MIREGTSRILYELSMARPCMKDYLYVGSPASNEKSRLVTKCRPNVNFPKLPGAFFFFPFRFVFSPLLF